MALSAFMPSLECAEEEEDRLPPVEFLASGELSHSQFEVTSEAASEETSSSDDFAAGDECPKLNDDRVYLSGIFRRQPTREPAAIALPTEPRHSCVGFENTNYGIPGIIRPTDGKFLWLLDGKIRVFTPDQMGWDSKSKELIYPDDPVANDGTVEVTCATEVSSFLIQPQSGEVYYRCDGNWYRENKGLVIVPERNSVLAVLPDDSIITKLDRGDEKFTLSLVDTNGDAIEIETPVDVGIIQTLRQTSDGTRLVVDFGLSMRLWKIVGSVATEEGVFAGLPADTVKLSNRAMRLDSDGVLWQFVDVETSSGLHYDGIVKRPLRPEQSEIVYHEGMAPSIADQKLRDPFVYSYQGYLITGP
jgi:hypothetical protein